MVNIRLSLTFILMHLLCLGVSGCAESGVSRDAASSIDTVVVGSQSAYDSASDSGIADTYQNLSQTSKGALIGGAVGAVTGSMITGVGVVPGAATGAILGGSYGAYIDSRTSLKDKLENRGATVVVLGDQVLISMPSYRLFDPRTAKLNSDAYSTLQLMAQYINSFTKMLVKVSGYTDANGPASVSLALSQQQAESASKALQLSGVDARVLYAVGYGGTNLVAKNQTVEDGSDNNRIEITLEKQYV